MDLNFDRSILYNIGKDFRKIEFYKSLGEYYYLIDNIYTPLKKANIREEDIKTRYSEIIERLKPFVKNIIIHIRDNVGIYLRCEIEPKDLEDNLRKLSKQNGEESKLIRDQVRNRSKNYWINLEHTDGRNAAQKEFEYTVKVEMEGFMPKKEIIINMVVDAYKRYHQEYNQNIKYE